MICAARCVNLSKRYQQRRQPPVDALTDLTLEIASGECFGLLGPNGAGKTTTVEILEGLLAPTSGFVEVLGRRWGECDDEVRQQIGISLQETRLTDKLTVAETLRLFRSFYHQGPGEAELLESVHLAGKRDSWVSNLSGGQRQRLAVACALVGHPLLLFLDEPTTGLDPQARRDVWEIVRRQKQRNCTTVLTTHYMEEAERLCDRVAIVDHGRLIALGTPGELIASLGAEHVIDLSTTDDEAARNCDEDALLRVEGVRSVQRNGSTWSLRVRDPHLTLPALLRRLESDGVTLAQLTIRHATLEDVFVNLTGRHLEDETVSPG